MKAVDRKKGKWRYQDYDSDDDYEGAGAPPGAAGPEAPAAPAAEDDE
jgi:hypothetical protein